MKNLNKVFKCFILTLPLVLYFSYYPIIPLGGNESMNFELSLPLLWLVIFDLVGLVMLLIQDGLLKIVKGIIGEWKWLLFPAFLTISCLWSLNPVRGLLTVGILWAIYLAGYLLYSFKDLLDKNFWQKFWRVVVWSSGVMCGFLLLQCILDLMGISREYTLMCQGCTYQMFGFPHPNGFAIEPQFMGNLLLFPLLTFSYLVINGKKNSILLFVIAVGLLLTFSRGAIYAGMMGLLFMTTTVIVKEKKKRNEVKKKIGIVWGLVIIAFLFTLNLQGLMAQVSPTNDTYVSGVSKVLNHLSLGIIDIRGEKEIQSEQDGGKEEAVFDGYVAESTDTRVRLTNSAMRVWSQDLKTMAFGVGLGGAGIALYNNGLSSSPKEIIQNQYASLLLETGLIGISLFVFTFAMIVRMAIKKKQTLVIWTLLVMYGVSLLFFSGIPNVLHIYLMTFLIFSCRNF